jgi:hypothetical protein
MKIVRTSQLQKKSVPEEPIGDLGLDLTPAPDEDVALAEAEADYLTRLRESDHGSISITIRMPRDLMLAVREAADRDGVRYQTLIKEWIATSVKPESSKPARPSQVVRLREMLLTTAKELLRAGEQMMEAPPAKRSETARKSARASTPSTRSSRSVKAATSSSTRSTTRKASEAPEERV